MKYLVMGVNGLVTKFTYRSNEVTNLITQMLQMTISICMWLSIYYSSGKYTINQMNAHQMIQYLVITNLTAILFSTSPIFRFANQVQSGQLTTTLLRPISIYGEHMAFYIGTQFPYLCINFTLFILLSNHATNALTFILLGYLILAFVMFFSLMLVIGTLSFWLINMWPLRSAINACSLILGGLYFPLSFLGQKTFRWLQFNPFSLVSDVPARVITHKINDLSPYIIAVVIWLLLTMIVYQRLIKIGIKKYEGIGI
ncbi:ABC-2 family transporter protein [Apilactobacillus xinyiensis]|uniref:ABC-2 family transporter protein n=1 Tax=Apilactobacillus xinyiensis TaxID=2841032 RepID=UPI00200EC146|nr:ABC-2 family transporter protein [Apilactobacillus xinyiensis]MCL0319302.1 ABC-2 family transporter protein [Apilactobacillus xinyiensis]